MQVLAPVCIRIAGRLTMNYVTTLMTSHNTNAGTGTSVYQDGEDVALVRATVVDSEGVTVHSSTLNITFRVTVGPARVVGVGNGDPADHDPNHAAWKRAYHGLVRAIFRSTVVATGTAESRVLAAAVNLDAGAGPRSSTIATAPSSSSVGVEAVPATSFTVTAVAQGLPTAHLIIPLSTNPADAPLNVAAASVDQADIGLGE